MALLLNVVTKLSSVKNRKIYIQVTTYVYTMAETVSVRIDKPGLHEISELSRLEKKTKSTVLREVLEKGIRDKKLEIALQKFRDGGATAWQAARIAGIPLTGFLDVLVQRGIDFHYGLKELKEDFEGLI